MKIAVICSLLFLVLLTNQACATMTSKQINKLKSLSKSEFGKTILASIKLELQANTNDPVDTIIASLDAIAADLNQEQSDADTSYTTNIDGCNAQVTQDQADLDQSNTDLQAYLAEQVQKQNFVESSTDQLNSDTSLLETLQNQLSDLQDVRNQQALNFAQAQADLQSSIAALQQAKQILQQLLVSTESFLLKKYQIKQKPVFLQFKEQFVSLLQSKSKGVRGFANFFLNLAQQPGIQADQAVVQQILGLMDDLLTKLLNDLQNQTQVESDRITQFQTSSDSMIQQINDLQNTVNQEAQDIADANTRLSELAVLIFNLQTQVENQTSTLSAQQLTCSQLTDTYNNDTLNRNDELALIAEVRAIFTSMQSQADQMQIINGLNLS